MSSGAKRRQTLAKVARERAVKEKRARKQEKRELRKQAAAERAAEHAAAVEGTEPDASAAQTQEVQPGLQVSNTGPEDERFGATPPLAVDEPAHSLDR